MSIAFGVHVGYAADHLTENMSADRLWKALVWLLFDVMVYAHALAQLHDKVHMRPLVHHLMQLHNVRMPQVRQGLDLSADSVSGSFSHEVLFIIGFYCYHVFGFFVLCSPHDSKSPLADLQAYLKVFQIQGLLLGPRLATSVYQPSESLESTDRALSDDFTAGFVPFRSVYLGYCIDLDLFGPVFCLWIVPLSPFYRG